VRVGKQRITLCPNHLDKSTWVTEEVDDIRAFLAARYDHMPPTMRIYHGNVCVPNDVTPSDQTMIDKLAEMPGPFYAVVYPAGVFILFAALAVAAYALAAPPIPPPPTALQRNTQNSSPNNDLSDRSNRARIGGRIPDIFGTVRSVPDLISTPYKVFENNREVEYAYMCIGRGQYDITDVRDGDTLCSNIPGTTLQFYEPYTSPNRNDTPVMTIGTPVQTPIFSARRSNSINGQVLRPPNASTFVGVGNIRFATPNQIQLFPNNVEDFTKYFVEGDEITITDASMSSGVAVTETVQCWATMTNKDKVFSAGKVGYTFEYGLEPGSLVFEMRDETTVNGLFTAGSSIILTQTFGPVALSGTYDVLSVDVVDPKTATVQGDGGTWNDAQRSTAVRNNAPAYLVVRLDAPETVNANWSSLYTGERFNQMQLFRFEVGHEAAQSYDIDLAGTYTIVSVTKEVITLDTPAGVNADWDILITEIATPYLSPTLVSSGERWVGPFIMTNDEQNALYCNFIAQNGLYKDDGITQEAANVEVEVEAWPVDMDDEQIDDSETFRVTLLGSSTLKETLAITLKAQLASFYGRCAVRARRITESDLDFDGNVVDEVRWRDLYSIASVGSQIDFGNVTTVMAVTFATASALAVKERKLNMLVSRRIPVWDGTLFDTSNLVATNDAAAILAAICHDKYLGNCPLEELDINNFFAMAAEVETYFGHASAREFSYTFDKDNLSFEEMFTTVARAMFCEGYRRGSTLRLSFEKATEDSTLLFNHRNKVPRSERRTVTFGGFQGEHDGLEYTHVDPRDDSITTIFLPAETVVLNPKRIESIGVRHPLQAYFHAWRAWNKLQYQNTIVEFDATSEANLLVRNDRILVTDSTRPNTQDGEVRAIDGLELRLSQRVDLTTDPPYTIFLQHIDGTVEAIPVTAGTNSNQVILDAPPAASLSVAPGNHARAGYILVGDTDTAQHAFLAVEKSPTRDGTATVKAINYDARYYGNDLDFINELIGENGYGDTGGFTPSEDGDSGYPPPAVYTPPFNLGNHNAVVEQFDFGAYTYIELAFSPDGNLRITGGGTGPENVTIDGTPATGSVPRVYTDEYIDTAEVTDVYDTEDYELRLTVLSGDAPIDSLYDPDVWYPIGVGEGNNPSYSLAADIEADHGCVWRVEIRRIGTTAILATGDFDFLLDFTGA
jgi:hypothetical protein